MDRISEAFEAVRRADFLPARERDNATYDGPIQIGSGQTNSQPATVADMLRLLDVRPGQHVLDVGAGSGWTTALLGYLVGPHGRVRGVELIASVATWGAANLTGQGLSNASLEVADPEVLGVPAHAPYDRILVSASPSSLPDALVQQLAVGGRMVIPVDGVMLAVVRTGTGIETSEHGHYRFVPLHVP